MGGNSLGEGCRACIVLAQLPHEQFCDWTRGTLGGANAPPPPPLSSLRVQRGRAVVLCPQPWSSGSSSEFAAAMVELVRTQLDDALAATPRTAQRPAAVDVVAAPPSSPPGDEACHHDLAGALTDCVAAALGDGDLLLVLNVTAASVSFSPQALQDAAIARRRKSCRPPFASNTTSGGSNGSGGESESDAFMPVQSWQRDVMEAAVAPAVGGRSDGVGGRSTPDMAPWNADDYDGVAKVIVDLEQQRRLLAVPFALAHRDLVRENGGAVLVCEPGAEKEAFSPFDDADENLVFIRGLADDVLYKVGIAPKYGS